MDADGRGARSGIVGVPPYTVSGCEVQRRAPPGVIPQEPGRRPGRASGSPSVPRSPRTAVRSPVPTLAPAALLRDD